MLRSDDGLWTHWFAAAGLRDVPEPGHGVLYHDSWNLLLAAISGQGIALVRRSFVLSEIAAGRLVRLFDVDYPSRWAYHFVCPVPLLATPRVQAFRDWIFEEVEQFCATKQTCSAGL